MKRIIAGAAVAVAVGTASFAGGTWWAQRSDVAQVSAHAANAYTCPMHPDYRSDHPGDCPICGMALEASPARGTTSGDTAPHALAPGAVQVSPERQHAIGIRVGVVRRLAGTRLLRTTGRVVPDENRTYPIVAAVSGWVRAVANVATGDAVKKDQVLASIAAPESQLEVAQQSYYTSLEMLYRDAQRRAAASRLATHAGRDRAGRRRATQPGRVQRAAQGDGHAPRPRVEHPRGITGGRRRAEAGRLARPAVRSGLRVLPDRGPEPGLDSRRRVRAPVALHPPGRLRADYHAGRAAGALGDGEPVGADVRRDGADPEGPTGGGEPEASPHAGHVRRRGVPRPFAGDAWWCRRPPCSIRATARWSLWIAAKASSNHVRSNRVRAAMARWKFSRD